MSGQGKGADFRTVTDAAALDGRQQYYGMVALIDAQLNRIWDALEQAGIYDETLIIITSDHGELLGDHGLWMKGPFHYEQVIRVPLLVKPPSSRTDELPVECHDPVSLVDIVPTCCDAAGIAVDGTVDGVSLFTPAEDRSVLVETVQDWHVLKCLSVVSRDHKLTCYPGESFGELTDFANDPGERTNLFDTDSGLKAQMMQRMLSLVHPLSRSNKKRISYA